MQRNGADFCRFSWFVRTHMSSSDFPADAHVRSTPRADILIVVALTALTALLATAFELNERVFYWTQGREQYQLDELPLVLLAFALALLWFARRRYRDALHELARRRVAETRLAATLEENRRLARQTIGIQEAERKHLARELHDEMGQYLNAIKIDAVSLQQRMKTPEGKADAQSAATLAAIMRNTDHVYLVINEMIRRLRPVGLDDLGLAAAIENCVDGWRMRLPETHFALEIDGDLPVLDEATNLTLYRMAQEGLTNVFKHARASHVAVRLARREPAKTKVEAEAAGEALVFSMRDDGNGATQAGSGLGLIGMRERVQALGGELTLSGGPGFAFTATIPLHPSPAPAAAFAASSSRTPEDLSR